MKRRQVKFQEMEKRLIYVWRSIKQKALYKK